MDIIFRFILGDECVGGLVNENKLLIQYNKLLIQ